MLQPPYGFSQCFSTVWTHPKRYKPSKRLSARNLSNVRVLKGSTNVRVLKSSGTSDCQRAQRSVRGDSVYLLHGILKLISTAPCSYLVFVMLNVGEHGSTGSQLDLVELIITATFGPSAQF